MVQKTKLIITILSCQQSLQNTPYKRRMHAPSSGHASEVSSSNQVSAACRLCDVSVFNLQFKSTNKAQSNTVIQPRDVNPRRQRGEPARGSIPSLARELLCSAWGMDGGTAAGESGCSRSFSSRKTRWPSTQGYKSRYNV